MMESKMKDKSFSFAVEMVLLFDRLRDNRKEYALSKQLLRSGTSIGALIREAQMLKAKPILNTNWELHKKNVMKRFTGLNYLTKQIIYQNVNFQNYIQLPMSYLK